MSTETESVNNERVGIKEKTGILYADCIGLLDLRRTINSIVNPSRQKKPFQSFRIIPPDGFFPSYENITSNIDPRSDTWTDPEDIKKYKESPIDINLRLIPPCLLNPEPQVAVSIPHQGVNLYMMLFEDKAIRIQGIARDALESEVDVLQSLIDVALVHSSDPPDYVFRLSERKSKKAVLIFRSRIEKGVKSIVSKVSRVRVQETF